jgi:hypothetical protein
MQKQSWEIKHNREHETQLDDPDVYVMMDQAEQVPTNSVVMEVRQKSKGRTTDMKNLHENGRTGRKR